MIRVFLVDDSAFVRRALTRVLAVESGFQVVGEAASGAEALTRITAADPDLVTLDVVMPGMDGLQLLPALLRWKPSLKVLMISSQTRDGADATVAALAAGAVDFIDKTTFNVMDLEYLRREVVDRMRAVTTGPRPKGRPRPAPEPPSTAAVDLSRCDLCVIGASTGGPAAVQRILQGLPASFPLPIVVVQHMPVGFTRPFAQRLASLSRVRVVEGEDGMRLTAGCAMIAPAGSHLRVSPNLAVVLTPEPGDAKHIPSVDVTMRSAARSRPGKVLGILLTGMGEDGADGMVTIRAGGGVTIAESETSCVVYGMPRAAVLRGAADWVLPLEAIADLLARGGRNDQPSGATDSSIQRR
ncbi:MAG TPA: chemotaxis-specific protein-glutamate methyltransferase CheB [Gemmatimonadales bacterium]|nr:chemotaxis-specific protein-glutamate methyltransferase CheB [Gemmatimonadales bacterium]